MTINEYDISCLLLVVRLISVRLPSVWPLWVDLIALVCLWSMTGSSQIWHWRYRSHIGGSDGRHHPRDTCGWSNIDVGQQQSGWNPSWRRPHIAIVGGVGAKSKIRCDGRTLKERGAGREGGWKRNRYSTNKTAICWIGRGRKRC
jgi:hypothetical protein